MNHVSCLIAGHVDHGKTSLVAALTGKDTDRLTEEKRRGLSIVLGYAYLERPDITIELIDAPGHEQFFGTMLAGASGCRMMALIVSAADGIERQTEEHFRSGDLMEMKGGVIVVSKSDLATDEELDACENQIRELVQDSFLADAPIIRYSMSNGSSAARVAQALVHTASCLQPAPAFSHFRLPVDRSFTVTGAGTVATGTLSGAAIAVGQQVRILPSGTRSSVRSLQIHDRPVKSAEPGARVAVNLRDITAQQVPRASMIVPADGPEATQHVDLCCRLTEDGRARLAKNVLVRLAVGTALVTARVLARELLHGNTWAIRLRMQQPVAAPRGSPILLRQASPPLLLGGGHVLDDAPAPSGRISPDQCAFWAALQSNDADRIVATALVASGHSGITRKRLTALAASSTLAHAVTICGREAENMLFDAALFDAACEAITAAIVRLHTEQPLQPAHADSTIWRAAALRSTPIARAALSHLVAKGKVEVRPSGFAMAGHDVLQMLSAEEQGELRRLSELFAEAGMSPPDHRQITGKREKMLIHLLASTGKLVHLYNKALKRHLYFHHQALDAAADQLIRQFPPPASFSTSEARTALLTNRKSIVPVLEYFDHLGLTKRNGDARSFVSTDIIGLSARPRPILEVSDNSDESGSFLTGGKLGRSRR